MTLKTPLAVGVNATLVPVCVRTGVTNHCDNCETFQLTVIFEVPSKTDCPRHADFDDMVFVSTGGGVTVTQATAVPVQPLDPMPVTVTQVLLFTVPIEIQEFVVENPGTE